MLQLQCYRTTTVTKLAGSFEARTTEQLLLLIDLENFLKCYYLTQLELSTREILLHIMYFELYVTRTQMLYYLRRLLSGRIVIQNKFKQCCVVQRIDTTYFYLLDSDSYSLQLC